ncbi:late competence development ComFB family protein [Clostridium sp. DJ247]|uniref:late competence development ComFB family protein n=1 Tax=Clostridium sp. DJ247 TaxID=2726188 RepID=UPI001F4CFC48|nr:late competence development ComFB family protein [Clostridium sp. DJ247]
MEEIVDEILPTVLKNYTNICKCEKCVDDIKAKALNNLKPLYVVTEEGVVYSKINELVPQFRTDVLNELVQAVTVVCQNPKHNL